MIYNDDDFIKNNDEFDSNDDNDNKEQTPSSSSSLGDFIFKTFVPIKMFINKKLVREIKREMLCTILNDEYCVYYLNNFKYDDGIYLSLECEQRLESSICKYSLFDAYEYLTKTHFLNFLSSLVFNHSTWINEDIDIQIQIVDTDVKRSKIVILLLLTDIPAVLFEETKSFDKTSSKSTYTCTDLFEDPITVREIRTRILFKPIIRYDVTFNIGSGMPSIFKNDKWFMIYQNISKKYIHDAISTFYPYYEVCQGAEAIGEKLIRTDFYIDVNDSMLRVQIICSPAVYVTNNEMYSYFYIDNKHMVSKESINSESFENSLCSDLTTFIERISSGIDTQVIITETTNIGIVNEFNMDYSIFIVNAHMCSIGRYLPSIKCPHYNNFKKINSKNIFIDSYMVPDNVFVVNKNNTDSINIYGFINLFIDDNPDNNPFADDLKKFLLDNREEIEKNCNVSIHDVVYGHIHLSIVYQHYHICRLMMFSYNNKKNNRKRWW